MKDLIINRRNHTKGQASALYIEHSRKMGERLIREEAFILFLL